MNVRPGAPESKTISADRLREVVNSIFQSAGSFPREADLIAQHLVEANLRGHDSHGVGVIPGYVRSARDGDLVLNQSLSVPLDLGGLLLCEAGQGAGQAMAHDAMVLGIARARDLGTCIVSLRDSHHIGRIGHWAEQCAEAGLVSIHFVNVVSEPSVAPFGGTMPRLGTNPFAAGFPRPEGPPIVVDFATSRWAVGKVRVAFNKGEEVPPGTLLDAAGQPTLDASALFGVPSGALVGFGEHKGFGLSLACELLAGALPGAKTQTGPRSSPATFNSMFSVIVSPERLGTAGPFKERLEAVLDWVRSENGNGTASILVPGEPELATRERRLREGIPVDAETLRQLSIAAEEAGSPERP